MKKKMVNRFTITLAHITPIQYPNLPFSQIVNCQAFSQSSSLDKESYSSRNLLLPNTFPWKTKSIEPARRL